MKLLTIILLSTILPLNIKAQCRVLTNQREDGVTVKYLRPDRIGFGDNLILALSMQTNGEQYFVATLSVFEHDAIKLKGNLTLKFSNNKSSVLEHFTSEITTYNGYPATVSIFVADKNDLANISSSSLTMALLQLENNIYQTIPVKMNGNILKQHYNCLTQ